MKSCSDWPHFLCLQLSDHILFNFLFHRDTTHPNVSVVTMFCLISYNHPCWGRLNSEMSSKNWLFSPSPTTSLDYQAVFRCYSANHSWYNFHSSKAISRDNQQGEHLASSEGGWRQAWAPSSSWRQPTETLDQSLVCGALLPEGVLGHFIYSIWKVVLPTCGKPWQQEF